MRRWIAGLLAAVCFVLPVWAFEASARGAALYNCLTGDFLWEQQGSTRMGMASTTKIMTALVALELYDLDQIVVIRPEWTGIEGSSMYLRTGERLTVRQLLYGLMLMSGNDSAAALAGLHPEGANGFVAAMNEKAAVLGLADTHFENPSGLDGQNHYTTARDLARLTAAALKNPAFSAVVSTKSITEAGRYMKNHNRLLFQLEGCIGVKTGFTKACGRCLVTAAHRNGRQFVAVTLGDPNDWRDHTGLMEEAFARLEPRTLLKSGSFAAVPVVGGTDDTANLTLKEDYTVWLSPEEADRVTVYRTGPRFLYAPAEAGQDCGAVVVQLGGTVIHEQKLYCADTVDLLPEPSLREKIKIWWESR